MILNGLTWGWPIWLYFYVGGIAGGAVATACVVNLVRGGRERGLGLAAIKVAGPLLVLAILLLTGDLGRPERFLNLLTVWQPLSPMWWGTWILAVSVFGYGALLLAYRMGRLDPPLDRLERALLVIALAGSTFLVVYTGVLLGQTRLVLWDTTFFVPALFALSALSTGMAATIVLAGRANEEAARRLEAADDAVLVLEGAILVGFTVWLGWYADAAGASAVAPLLLAGELGLPFLGLVAIIGIAAPLFLSISRVAHRPWERSLLVLIGGLALRYVLVVGGQIPA